MTRLDDKGFTILRDFACEDTILNLNQEFEYLLKRSSLSRRSSLSLYQSFFSYQKSYCRCWKCFYENKSI